MPTTSLVLLLCITAQDTWEPDRSLLSRNGGDGTVERVRDALGWLARHQSEDGSWGSAAFTERCALHGGEPCDGEGLVSYDVGVTGLAVLAFTGTGARYDQGEYQEPLARAVDWLVGRQGENGLIGSSDSHDFFYDHLVATYALCEALHRVDDDTLRASAQAALRYVESGRNPYGAWRYDVPSIGDDDTSITVWALSALVAGKRSGFEIDVESLRGGLDWLVHATREGRTGYDGPGTYSARTPANMSYPREIGEAMTAAAVWARLLLCQDPEGLEASIELVRAKPPEWVDDSPGNDMYFWLHGTYAMFQVGGKPWKEWNTALKRALRDGQRDDGSWDPIGPWGYAGGRVYSTAALALALEVYYRYPRFTEELDSDDHIELVHELYRAPVIEALHRWIAEEREVVLRTFDWTRLGARHVEIRYRLDGGDPGKGDKVFRKPIVLKKDALLVARVLVDGEPVGETATRAFTKVEPLEAERVDGLESGLMARFHAGSWETLDDVVGHSPTREYREADLYVAMPDEGVLQLIGFIEAVETEVHLVEVPADARVRVEIGGRPVEEGLVALEGGYHALRVDWRGAKGERLDLTIRRVGTVDRLGLAHRPE